MRKYYRMINFIEKNSVFVGKTCYSISMEDDYIRVIFPEINPKIDFLIRKEHLKEISKKEYMKNIWNIDKDS